MTGSLIVPSIGFGLVTASILALAAVGFTVQFGVTNVLNLAYGDIMTASALVGYFANRAGAGILEALVVGAAFGSLASTALNRFLYMPFLRRGTKLFGMVVVTLSVGIIIENVVLAVAGPTFLTYNVPFHASVHAIGFVFTISQLVIMAVAVGAMAAVHLLLTRTRLGKAMRATAANPELARASGIATDRVIDIAWLLSGALCGLAGVVLVLNTSAFQSTTGNDFLVIVVAAAMLGGVGQPTGAMVAALVLGIATELAATYIMSSFKEVIAFSVLVVVLLVRPQGLLGPARVYARSTG